MRKPSMHQIQEVSAKRQFIDVQWEGSVHTSRGNCSPGWHFWVARGGLDVSQGMDDSAVSIPPERP